MTTTMILLACAVLVAALLLARRRRREGGLQAYFEAAVRVAVWRDDAAATLAALAAARVASPAERLHMTTFLARLSGLFRRAAVRASQGDACQARLDGLAEKLSAPAWQEAGPEEARLALARVDPELGEALERGDAGVFRRRHPRLFEARSVLDLMEMDRPDARGPAQRLFDPFR